MSPYLLLCFLLLEIIQIAVSQINVPATSGTYSLSQSVTITGKGHGIVTNVNIINNYGTMEIGGTIYSSLVYVVNPNLEGYNMCQIISIGSGDVFISWVYSDSKHPNRVKTIYVENANEGLKENHFQAVKNMTITYTNKTASVLAHFPALNMPYPPLLSNIYISGPKMSLSPGKVGSLNGEYQFYPFNLIDCSECGDQGWHELHALISKKGGSEVWFGIIYLSLATRRVIGIQYSFSMLTYDTSTDFDAYTEKASFKIL